ncbi:MAG: phosphotransferase family protein [Bacillota bacterium]
MTDFKENKAFAEVVRKIDPLRRLLSFQELSGGVSARTALLETERPDGRREKLLFRQHGARDLRRNPRIAADEYRLLGILRSAGLPVPKPYALDTSRRLFPAPYLVMEFIEGEAVDDPADPRTYLHQTACHLSRIHRVDASRHDLSFLPKQEALARKILERRPASPKDAWNEGRIRRALERVWPFPRSNPDVLLHGDFWPGNLLWKEGGLVAVIDWEDAALGDPLADVANARLEILWAFGAEAMRRFTEEYRSMMPHVDFTHLPRWDLYAALRPVSTISGWGLGDARESVMRKRHRLFVAQALEKLGFEP